MAKVFYYAVLRYQYSLAIEEYLNLGIAFYFPEEKKIVFRHPHDLSRIKGAYPKFEPKFTMLYLQHFVEQADRFNLKWFRRWFDKDDAGRAKHSNEYNPLNCSSIQFGRIRTVLKYSDDVNKIVDGFYDLEFPESVWGDAR